MPESTTKGSVEAEIETIEMVNYFPISEERICTIRSATREDKKMQTLLKTNQKGWPQKKNDTPRDVRHNFSFQEELSVQERII